MTRVSDCRCEGDFCTCNGGRVLRDGRRASLAVMMKDSAVTTTTTMSIEDRAALPMYDHLRGLPGMRNGMSQAHYRALMDSMEPLRTKAEVTRDHYAEKATQAWRGPANQSPNLALDAAAARAKMIDDLTNAWRG